MKFVQIVFSPTGGTKKAADIITEEWENAADTVVRIDLSNPETDASQIALAPEDTVLIALPSYGGRVPALAAKRLLKINGAQAQCILVCVYGNRAYEDTLAEMQDLAAQCGFCVVAAVSAVAEHSIARQYAAGRPDEKDKKKLRSFAKTIYKKQKSEKAAAVPKIPGNRPYKKAGSGGLTPKAGKGCIGCGLCAKNCPAQAIRENNLKTADSKKCISCMRCVSICPKSVRKANSAMVSVVGLALKKACKERKENELFL